MRDCRPFLLAIGWSELNEYYRQGAYMLEWRTIEGFEDYEISNEGQVFSHKSNKFLSPWLSGRGYLQVGLRKDGRTYTKTVHRLVAKTFIPNPNNLPVVNHLDENQTNNRVENLEWCSQEHNVKYSSYKNWKPVASYNLQGELIAEYPCLTAAAEAVGRSKASINHCLTGRTKTCAGFIWKYI